VRTTTAGRWVLGPSRQSRGRLRRGLKADGADAAFDDRMHRRHRQGKTSFYMKCTGEEAIACAQAMVLTREDMTFPT
jgi:2-oxoisovalerate dehydrogenase E1 component alpha subunit